MQIANRKLQRTLDKLVHWVTIKSDDLSIGEENDEDNALSVKEESYVNDDTLCSLFDSAFMWHSVAEYIGYYVLHYYHYNITYFIPIIIIRCIIIF